MRVEIVSKDERVGTVEQQLRGLLEVLLFRIENGEINGWLEELKERIALDDEIEGRAAIFEFEFAQGFAQERHAFGKITLFRAQPESAARTSGKKARAVGSAGRGGFPTKRTRMLVRRAAAMLSVLRADAMSILRDLSPHEMRIWQRGNQIANQLRLADAPRVTADNDHAARGRFCLFSLCQLLPLTL